MKRGSKLESKKEYQKNQNGSYTRKETQTFEPEDQFVSEDQFRPVGRSMETDMKAVKGKISYVHYETNNPVITRYVVKLFTLLFLVIGVIAIFSSHFFFAKIIGVVFLITAIFVHKSANKRIDELEAELKESDSYTPYTKEEEKEVLKEAKEEVIHSAKGAAKEVFASESTKDFSRRSFPIMLAIVALLSVFIFLAVSKVLGVIIFVVGSLVSALFCFVFLKLLSKIFEKL